MAKQNSTFGWLNATQFLSVLNDNIFKLLVITFVIGLRGPGSAGRVAATGGAIFVLPFLLFMAPAGRIADRFSKSEITVILKFAEIVVMVLGVAAFVIGSEAVLFGVLFLLTSLNAFFGPAKYGIVPELVGEGGISSANGFLEAFLYLASLTSAVIVPPMLSIVRGSFPAACIFCVLTAGAGFATSLAIRKTEAADKRGSLSIFCYGDIFRTIVSIRGQRGLLLAVLGGGYFLLAGAFLQLNLIAYGMERLGLDQTKSLYLFLPGAIGVAAGAFAAGRVSGRFVETALVPAGSAGMTISIFALGLSGGGLWSVVFFVFLAGVSAGLLAVPINAYIQVRSPADRRGRIIAASGFIGWLGVAGGSVLLYILSGPLGISAAGSYVVLGILSLLVTAAVGVVMLGQSLRFLIRVLVKGCYRLTVAGRENIPREGAAILVSNHCAWVDPLLLIAAVPRHIHFVMDKEFYNKWWLKPFSILMKVIPISSQDSPEQILGSLSRASVRIESGGLVCIFAEGAMTRTGEMGSFKKGLRWLMENSSCPIVPVYIGGTWGSIFSYYYGRPASTLPKRFRHRVGVYFGKAVEGAATVEEIRQRVYELKQSNSGQ